MLKQIRYFQAVVRHNSFSEAAEACFISQSAVSQQIQALEHELGIQLLERKNRKFNLTPAGEYFYRKSLILVADYEQLCRETARIAHAGESSLRIGYLRSYSGNEFHQALDEFTQKHPDVSVRIEHGNHEELYGMLGREQVDLVLNDQRRMFSDAFVNLILTTAHSSIEISSHSPLADLKRITPSELKNIPCILVTSEAQQETEREYYHDIVGFRGEYVFAGNLEEARLLVVSGKGFMPVEGGKTRENLGTSICRIPLYQGDTQVTRNYCLFWKKDNSGYYIEEFAEILKSKFE